MITITEAAAAAIKRVLNEEQRPEGTYMRVRVQAGGCSGLSYSLSFEDEALGSDRVIDEHGVRLLLDPKSELYLAGSRIDFQSGLSGQGFVFDNPNATGGCGCGKSFCA